MPVSHAGHLISRFLGSLRPGGPSVSERAWVAQHLQPAELEIWSRMPGPDRRHSAAVARRVEQQLGPSSERPVLAAALLHDCGKLASGLRTPGRVMATVLAAILGRDEVRSRTWSERGWPRRRVGMYWRHPELGAAMLEDAGSAAFTVRWALEHHRPPSQCTLDPVLAGALRDADDD
jgi:hypothetical protein